MTVFVAVSQFSPDRVTYALRTAGDPLSYVKSAHEIVREADSRIPLANVVTQAAEIDRTISRELMFANLCTGFAVLALLMECVGLYGTMSYCVARQVGEIGIRMALGAQRAAVVWMVLRRVLLLGGGGIRDQRACRVLRNPDFFSYALHGKHEFSVKQLFSRKVVPLIEKRGCWMSSRSVRSQSPLIAMILAGTCLFAQIPQRIKLNNQNSIVFIHSERRQKNGTGSPEVSYGTGFLISSRGHVLTASHVILNPGPDTIVENWGALGSRYDAPYRMEFVRGNSDLCAAILLLPDVGQRWQPVTGLDERLSMHNGDPIYTLGFPLTYDLTPAQGVLGNPPGPRGRWETTIAIGPGSSGSPVFDTQNRVVALAVEGRASAPPVSYAVPTADLVGWIGPEIIHNERELRPVDPALESPQSIKANLNEPLTLLSKGKLSVIYTDLGPRVRVEVQAPSNVYPNLEFDVNANGVIDPGLDIYYGTRLNGTGCNGYLHGIDLTVGGLGEGVTQCWTRRSASEVQIHAMGDLKRYTWILPKDEIARHPGSFVQFIVRFLDSGEFEFDFPSRPFTNPMRISW